MKTIEDSTGVFSVASAWETIRRIKERVSCHRFISSNAILPRYQLNLWLITKWRLPTQSLLMSHGRIDAASCPFCNKVLDSINHLFFVCRITSSIAFFWGYQVQFFPGPIGLGRRLLVGLSLCSRGRSSTKVSPVFPLVRFVTSFGRIGTIFFSGGVAFSSSHEEASPQGR